MQGLAYSVSGSWSSTPIDHPGLFVGGGETANIADFLRLLKAAFQVCRNRIGALPSSNPACGS